jgi:hypothetical protein
VVIFYAPTHGELPAAFPPRRPKNALYALVSTEQPKYAGVLSNTKYLESHFDLMVTYSLQETYPGTNIPNLPITYYPLNMLSPNAVRQAPRSFTEKDGFGTGRVPSLTITLFFYCTMRSYLMPSLSLAIAKYRLSNNAHKLFNMSYISNNTMCVPHLSMCVLYRQVYLSLCSSPTVIRAALRRDINTLRSS